MIRCRTLIGQENEVAFAAIDRYGGALPRADYVKRLIMMAGRSVPHVLGGMKTDFFLANGGRLYVDAGEHPEWATPECSSPFEVVTWRAAGERILEDAADAVERLDPRVRELVLSRVSVDYTSGATRGGHENYLVTRPLLVHAQQIIPHLVSRIVFTGAGGFDNTRPGASFMISPRVAHLTVSHSGTSTSERAIFHVKDEPLCEGGYHRMHLLCGENLLSHTSDVLRMGTTALVALMVDAGARPDVGVRLADPVAAMRTFAFDPTCTETVQLVSGGSARALDIQWHYLQRVEQFLSTVDGPSWGTDVCKIWRDVLTQLDREPSSLDNVLDWRIKLALFRSYVARHGLSWEAVQALSGVHYPGGRATLDRNVLPLAPAVRTVLTSRMTTTNARYEFWRLRDDLCELDVKICRVGTRGLFNQLDAEGLLQHRLVCRSDVERAVKTPPEGRAAVRGEAIRWLSKQTAKNGLYRADWVNVLDFEGGRFLDLRDPYIRNTTKWQDLSKVGVGAVVDRPSRV